LIVILFLRAQHAQTALMAQAQHFTLLRIAEFHPVKAFVTAAQAADAVAARIYLADAATGTGYREKLKLLRHSVSALFNISTKDSAIPAPFSSDRCVWSINVTNEVGLSGNSPHSVELLLRFLKAVIVILF
jgi:hypothetical protein